MTQIDTSKWGQFKVGELFDCETTKGIASKNDLVEGNIPYVTWSAENNGKSGSCGNADKIVKVTVTKNKITFYNDGEKIDEKLIKDIFTQYKKGIKGKFGLGLSIVKQSLELYGYKIKVSNQEKGVLFEIL